MSSAATNVRHILRIAEVRPEIELQGRLSSWQRLFPRVVSGTMTQEAKGIFIPYPLLAILTVIGMTVCGGIITLCTMVYSMNTTMLLRDSDHKEEQRKAWEKIEQLEVYIHDDRERLARIEAARDNNQEKRKNNHAIFKIA